MNSPQRTRQSALAVIRRPRFDFLDLNEPRGVTRWRWCVLVFAALVFGACQGKPQPAPANTSPVAALTPAPVATPFNIVTAPFNFQISSGPDQYQIEGFIALARLPGRLPAVLVLNGDKGNARQCIDNVEHFVSMGVQVACISLPGYGRSSGPSRFVGQQSVDAARRALDLLAARTDVDPARLAVWGLAEG